MLEHKIVKYQPPANTYLLSNYQSRANKSVITSQADLDGFLIGQQPLYSIVKWKNAGPLFGLYQVNLVVDIQSKFDKLTFGYNGFPETHYLISVNLLDNHQYSHKRWVDIRDYGPLADAEFEDWVDDKLQNRIKAFIETRNKEISAAS